MHLGTQPAHSIQFDRKENEIVKAAGASVPAYVRNSKMAGTQPVTAVRGNLAAARTSILNRANSDAIEHSVLLLSGCVKITQQGQRGNKAILRLSGVGEVIGAFGLDRKSGSTAQVVQPCTASSGMP